jgi:predicted lysophospholipase L1 biosynthesis ABC-type transport system permease subunit
MNLRREIILSLKQTRRSRGKFLFSAMAIVLGVAAISAVRSFSSSLENAENDQLQEQIKKLTSKESQ